MPLSWQSLLVVLPLFLTAPIAVYLLHHLFRQRRFLDWPLMLVIGLATLWSLGYGFELVLPRYEQMILASIPQCLAIALVPVAWLLLGLHLADQLQRLRAWAYPMLLAIPAVTLIMMATWQMHSLYWAEKVVVAVGDLTVLRNTYGPWFWVALGYAYLMQLAGAAFIAWSIWHSTELYARQRLALAVALLLPWTANAVYVFRWGNVPIDLTPVAIVGSGLLIIYGIRRFGLGDVVPVARARLVAEMREGVMVFDDRGRLVDANPAALSLFQLHESDTGRDADFVLANHPALKRLVHTPGEMLYNGVEGRLLRVSARQVEPRGGYACQLLVVGDLSLGHRIETVLRLIVERTSGDTGEDFFRSLTKALVSALGCRSAMVGTVSPPDDNDDVRRLDILAFWDGEAFVEGMSYRLDNLPSAHLLHQRTFAVSSGLLEQFPEARAIEPRAESYLGTQLIGSDDSLLGILALIGDEPIADEEMCRSVLEVFATRAAAEIERRAANLKLEASETRYRRIVETTRDGVCIIDRSGRIEFLNEPMAKMIGASREGLPGEHFWSRFTVEGDRRSALEAFEDATVEAHLIRADGVSLWAAVSKSVDHTSGDSMLLMVTDVTQPRLLEEENKQMELQLQHTQKLESLGVLAGGIAHDFNNLLMPILGYLDLIADRAGDDALTLDYLRRMRDAGSRLADLCNQMLTYSGKAQYLQRPLDLNHIVSRMTELVRASISSQLDVTWRLSEAPLTVIADETQIDQIIINLVINASEAMAERKSGRISVSTGKDVLDDDSLQRFSNGENLSPGPYVWVEVADEGTGIEPHNLKRLFEPFFSTKFTGRGLGMAVVFGITRAHDGAIEVESHPGEGTRIRVYFPERDAVIDTATTRSGDSTLAADGAVLVVDDEESVRMLIARMLESRGLNALLASNGAEGLDTFAAHSELITACILDVTMPEIDGYDLAREIRQQKPGMAVVLVSGFDASIFDHERVGDAHTAFLQKPFAIDDLLAALEDAGEVRHPPSRSSLSGVDETPQLF